MSSMKNRQKRPSAPYEAGVGVIPVADTEPTSRYHDVFTPLVPGICTAVDSHLPGSLIFATAEDVFLRVDVLGEKMLRFRYAVRSFRPAASYALASLPSARKDLLTHREDANHHYLDTGKLICRISKEQLRIEITDAATGKVILSDAAPFYARETIRHGLEHLRMSWQAMPDEQYLGLGDKSCALNLRHRYLQLWNTDAFGFGADTDPLYRSVPFYYGLLAERAYGIFLHNTWRTHFDFDSRRDGVSSMWAEGGEMDFFFMYGPSLDEVAQAYHRLTGTAALPPLWALGFHQCRWSYRTEGWVRELAATFRSLQIPCDAIYLDIDYMHAYQCFTWNGESFPDPATLAADLREQGFRLVSMIDPGISASPGYFVYEQGRELDAFCRRSSGEVMTGPVWPNRCVWPDFTKPEVRMWWGGLYRGLYLEDGISGFWNDMNEPAVFKVDTLTFPDEVMHHLDGRPGNHREAHNIYGLLMARASYEGMRELDPQRRPFLLSRATFSGGQRYAAIWTGDNVASWEHLRIANLQCQRLSISGFSFVGTDVGGFVDMPSGELFTRWVQLGAFHPLFRIHSMGNNAGGAIEADAAAVASAETKHRLDQEPWAFGQPYTDRVREAINLRYRLLPYLYTAFYEHAQEGLPVIRSLAFGAAADPQAGNHENIFFFGKELLVSPVLQPGQQTQRIYLPVGEWYDFHTGKHYEGGKHHRLRLHDEYIPLFARAGAVIPMGPVMQHTAAFEPDTIDLQVFFGEKGGGACYCDSGEGYGYLEGDFRLHTFTLTADKRHLRLVQTLQGAYTGGASVFRLLLRGLPFVPAAVTMDGVSLQEIEEEAGALVLYVPVDFSSVELTAGF